MGRIGHLTFHFLADGQRRFAPDIFRAQLLHFLFIGLYRKPQRVFRVCEVISIGCAHLTQEIFSRRKILQHNDSFGVGGVTPRHSGPIFLVKIIHRIGQRGLGILFVLYQTHLPAVFILQEYIGCRLGRARPGVRALGHGADKDEQRRTQSPQTPEPGFFAHVFPHGVPYLPAVPIKFFCRLKKHPPKPYIRPRAEPFFCCTRPEISLCRKPRGLQTRPVRIFAGGPAHKNGPPANADSQPNAALISSTCSFPRELHWPEHRTCRP